MKNDTSNIVIRNRRASFEYEFVEKYIAGIQLRGTEIKALRLGKANVTDSYCQFYRGELFVKGLNIAEYSWGNINNHDPVRERKLLLTSRELRKLERKVKESGLTIIVLKLFINERGLAKVEIALAKGRKAYDKRENLKQKDARREMDRAAKK
ncbi:MAG: SsrA-binding protein SmpB [Bacteroidales bacterium]|jgi:SsrA-binding protein|nr:SsrA-binding protein SmpB [Bacteroidales bacterium]